MASDPAFVGALVRSICTLSPHDFDEVLGRLEDPSRARMSRGSTWSIFKALDAMDPDARRELHGLIVAQRHPNGEASPLVV